MQPKNSSESSNSCFPIPIFGFSSCTCSMAKRMKKKEFKLKLCKHHFRTTRDNINAPQYTDFFILAMINVVLWHITNLFILFFFSVCTMFARDNKMKYILSINQVNVKYIKYSSTHVIFTLIMQVLLL